MTNHVLVDAMFNEMTEGERCHMANKLWKHGYRNKKADDACEVLASIEMLLEAHKATVDSVVSWADVKREVE